MVVVSASSESIHVSTNVKHESRRLEAYRGHLGTPGEVNLGESP